MKRTLIKEAPEKIGEEVKIFGWVNVNRDHGKVIFVDLRDRSGMIQLVVTTDNQENFDLAKKCKSECVIEVEGKVKERPQKLANKEMKTGGVEIEVTGLKMLSQVEGELPFEISQKDLDLNLQTLLENRNLTLRNKKINDIFKVYSATIDSYRQALKAREFMEIKSPKILSAVSEGGANFFKVKYFKQEAFLAQSPQFYKQAGVSLFERVFEVGPVFRAEPHFTSRHVNEYVSLDAEMGFIDSYEDLMDELEGIFWDMMEKINQECSEQLEEYKAEVPKKVKIPRMKLAEALKILEEKYDKKMDDLDIDPEGERMICDHVKKEFGSDLVFLTHYPKAVRPMYTMPCKDSPEETCSFDLIFRGVEISTGGQRIHNYKQLKQSMIDKKFDPANFKHYLEIFKYGTPPHGGWGMGSERIVQKILGLKSIKEAVLFPRDVKRLTP
jgi:nondiscriminating aspartyl-tRNA synthetase